LLGERIAQHQVKCWLVNTGWGGGPYGVGRRIPIAYTRRTVQAALNGELDDVPMRTHRIFGFQVPSACEGIPMEILQPQQTWLSLEEYDRKAAELARQFSQNFEQFAAYVPADVRLAGPMI